MCTLSGQLCLSCLIESLLQWFNVCWSFLIGVATALDTLGSQAYGNGRPQTVLSCCVSAIVVLLLLCLPLTAAMMAASHVAQTVFGQTPEEAAVSKSFAPDIMVISQLLTALAQCAWYASLSCLHRWWPPSVKACSRELTRM